MNVAKLNVQNTIKDVEILLKRFTRKWKPKPHEEKRICAVKYRRKFFKMFW